MFNFQLMNFFELKEIESIDTGVKLKIIRKYFTRFQSKIT